MSQTKYHIPTLYNPKNLSKTELIENFVIRTKEFEQIFYSIKNDEMKNPPQHIIVQGQRGSGKTTLLLRIYYEVTDDEKLKDWLIPIMFDEEQYGIRTLEKIWERLAEYLEEHSDLFPGIGDELDKIISENECEEKCFELLSSYLKKRNKKLVLFIDNFGDMVRKFKEKEIKRLREILMTSPDIRLIAGSSTVLEFTYDHSLPFYEFFKVFPLNGLNKNETIDLLLKLGESYKAEEIKNIIKNESARVEALRRLTSGVPRTIVLLFDIFVDNENGSAFRDLEMTLDAVTPLYKHRMDDLPAQQQEIVDVIALNWDAISVKEIVLKTRMESKAVSSQLKLLVKNKVIEKEPTSTKNHLYRVHERFFNIWYLMRYGRRKHREKVKFLVKFLEVWCSQEELMSRATKHIEAVKDGKVHEKQALYMTEALAQTSISPEIQDKLIKETRSYLQSIGSKLAEELSHSDYEVFEEITELLKEGDEQLALKKAEEIRELRSEALLLVGHLYEISLGDFLKAEKYYEKAVGKGNNIGFMSIALLYHQELKDYGKAKENYLKAIETGNIDAMFNLAMLYQQKYKDYEKAEEYLLKAIKAGDRGAMNNLAFLYEHEYKDYQKAEQYYLEAISAGVNDAISNLAILYDQKHKNYVKAEEYYLKAIKQDHTNSTAMFNLALLYEREYSDYEKAEKYYLKAAKINNDGALNNLAILHFYKHRDYKKSEKYFLEAIKLGNTRALHGIAYQYFSLNTNKEKALGYAQKAFENDFTMKPIGSYILVLLWNNDIEKAVDVFEQHLFKEENVLENVWHLTDVMTFFLAKKQYNYLYKLFEKNEFNIKERYKPVYYALLSFMGEKHSDELKKMGPELRETVDEIIERVKELREKYD